MSGRCANAPAMPACGRTIIPAQAGTYAVFLRYPYPNDDLNSIIDGAERVPVVAWLTRDDGRIEKPVTIGNVDDDEDGWLFVPLNEERLWRPRDGDLFATYTLHEAASLFEMYCHDDEARKAYAECEAAEKKIGAPPIKALLAEFGADRLYKLGRPQIRDFRNRLRDLIVKGDPA